MLLRALPRTGPRVSSGCTCICPSRRLAGSVRTFRTSTPLTAATFESSQQRSDNQPPTSSKSQQHKSMHAIANPTLAGIEKRWEEMPPQKQAELWMLLRDRMKVDWHEMTLQEKKIAWWIAFGPHGPRAEDPPGEWTRIFLWSGVGCLVAGVLFAIIRAFARPPPRTMTKEWQEATNEYLKKEKSNPIYGISSEGYTGKGAIQSKPAGKS